MILSNSLALIHVLLLLFIKEKKLHFLETCFEAWKEDFFSKSDVGSCDWLEEERQVVSFFGTLFERPGLWA